VKLPDHPANPGSYLLLDELTFIQLPWKPDGKVTSLTVASHNVT